MRIVVVGGGKIGAHLAALLHPQHTVAIIEQRPERVEVLRARIPDVDVIVGDACEIAVLEAAGTNAADVIVAVTGDDEDNLVVAMLAKALHPGTTVYARVNHPHNEWLFDREWGVDAALSASSVLYEVISRDLGLQDLVTLLNLQADGVEIDEYSVPEGAAKAGATLGELTLPPNVTVMAVLTPEGMRAARGDTVLAAGDKLLLLAEGVLDAGAVRAALGVAEGEPAGD